MAAIITVIWHCITHPFMPKFFPTVSIQSIRSNVFHSLLTEISPLTFLCFTHFGLESKGTYFDNLLLFTEDKEMDLPEFHCSAPENTDSVLLLYSILSVLLNLQEPFPVPHTVLL